MRLQIITEEDIKEKNLKIPENFNKSLLGKILTERQSFLIRSTGKTTVFSNKDGYVITSNWTKPYLSIKLKNYV